MNSRFSAELSRQKEKRKAKKLCLKQGSQIQKSWGPLLETAISLERHSGVTVNANRQTNKRPTNIFKNVGFLIRSEIEIAVLIVE